jgi:hypothetical protein
MHPESSVVVGEGAQPLPVVGTVRERLIYDAATGEFTWRVRPARNVFAGARAGRTDAEGYRTISFDNRQYKAHRLAWLYMTGFWPPVLIDHIDGCRSNNRWSNLRLADATLNSQNLRCSHRDSGTSLLGVRRAGSKFEAKIQAHGVSHYLGTFPSPEEAHQAYVKAKRAMHMGCTI